MITHLVASEAEARKPAGKQAHKYAAALSGGVPIVSDLDVSAAALPSAVSGQCVRAAGSIRARVVEGDGNTGGIFGIGHRIRAAAAKYDNVLGMVGIKAGGDLVTTAYQRSGGDRYQVPGA